MAQNYEGLTVCTEFEGGVYIEYVYVVKDSLGRTALQEEIEFLLQVSEFMSDHPNMILGERGTSVSPAGLAFIKRQYAVLVDETPVNISPF